MSSAVVVIAQLEAKPAFSTEFRAALTPLIAATVQEPGCHSYQLHQS
jgi:quinol monooxygenase YgiN